MTLNRKTSHARLTALTNCSPPSRLLSASKFFVDESLFFQTDVSSVSPHRPWWKKKYIDGFTNSLSFFYRQNAGPIPSDEDLRPFPFKAWHEFFTAAQAHLVRVWSSFGSTFIFFGILTTGCLSNVCWILKSVDEAHLKKPPRDTPCARRLSPPVAPSVAYRSCESDGSWVDVKKAEGQLSQDREGWEAEVVDAVEDEVS